MRQIKFRERLAANFQHGRKAGEFISGKLIDFGEACDRKGYYRYWINPEDGTGSYPVLPDSVEKIQNTLKEAST